MPEEGQKNGSTLQKSGSQNCLFIGAVYICILNEMTGVYAPIELPV